MQGKKNAIKDKSLGIFFPLHYFYFKTLSSFETSTFILLLKGQLHPFHISFVFLEPPAYFWMV